MKIFQMRSDSLAFSLYFLPFSLSEDAQQQQQQVFFIHSGNTVIHSLQQKKRRVCVCVCVFTNHDMSSQFGITALRQRECFARKIRTILALAPC